MQNDYDRRTTHRHKLAPLLPTGAARERRLRLYLLAVCNHLVGGLALTGLVAYIAHDSGLDQALARLAHSHATPPSTPPNAPLIWGLALIPAAFVFLPLFRIRKQKRLKENSRSGFPSKLFFFCLSDSPEFDLLHFRHAPLRPDQPNFFHAHLLVYCYNHAAATSWRMALPPVRERHSRLSLT